MAKNGRIVIDTETTGLDAGWDEVLQLAVTDGEGQELWCKYYKPSHVTAWPQAQAVNGISPDDVANADNIADDVRAIQAIVDDASEVCIYNAPFDLGFLEAAGVDFEGAEVVDTMLGASARWGGRDEHRGERAWIRLAAAAERCGYDWGGGAAHDALADCRATAYVQRWLDEDRGVS